MHIYLYTYYGALSEVVHFTSYFSTAFPRGRLLFLTFHVELKGVTTANFWIFFPSLKGVTVANFLTFPLFFIERRHYREFLDMHPPLKGVTIANFRTLLFWYQNCTYSNIIRYKALFLRWFTFLFGLSAFV